MTTQLRPNVSGPAIGDLVIRIEIRRRTKELRELAAEEGITLPMPAEWIAALEAAGIMVDLVTGEWQSPDGVRYAPTAAARKMAARREDPNVSTP